MPCGGPIHPSVAEPLRVVEAQLKLMAGRADKVRAAAGELSQALGEHAEDEDGVQERLAALLAKKKGHAAREAGAWLLERDLRPGPLEQLLGARERKLKQSATAAALERIARGELSLVPSVAAHAQASPELLQRLREPLESFPRPLHAPLSAQGLEAWLAAGDPATRALVGQILDQDGPITEELAWRVLGDTAEPLVPWLLFTRATASDLVRLVPEPGRSPRVARHLPRARQQLGDPLLGEVLGRLGWERVCWGLKVSTWVGLRPEGSQILVLCPEEAELVSQALPCTREWERQVVVAMGGSASQGAEGGDEKMSIFRAYNLVHAQALTEIMAVAPLDAARARRILDLTRSLVRDFCRLFAEHTEDVHALPRVFASIEQEVERRLEDLDDSVLLDPELTRYVLMFEDPRGVTDIRTLHGLKRWVHQTGLSLAFKLFRGGSQANRTVDILVCEGGRVRHELRRIRYIDFEPGRGLNLPVRWAVQGLTRALLHGRTSLPAVEVLSYGNEVQVYVAFRNHPAFVRLDLSPPQRGGMIDLEYFGVSQYELDQHPDTSLYAIQAAFREEEFDTAASGLRLHFRYDKERAFDLGDLVRKARALFRLVPWLMELDWTVGGLDLPLPARRAVADAWARRLARWGALPEEELLSPDRRSIVTGIRRDPAGDELLVWSGRGDYVDRLPGPDPALLDRVGAVLRERGLDRLAAWEEERGDGAAMLPLERCVLEPLRDAVERGEVSPDLSGPCPGFIREHEALRLAGLVEAGDLAAAAQLAASVRSVERSLRFLTTGEVQGRPVQRTTLPLREGPLSLFVLRDDQSIARLALATWGGGLEQDRPHLDTPRVEALLRRDNYLVGEEPRGSEDLDQLARRLRQPAPPTPPPSPHERVVPVLAAAPGRASGFARLRGQEQEGEVLVTAALRPEDAPALRRCAAVLTTGGGVLSHAGLVALELRKPAVIAAGRWEGEDELVLRVPLYTEVPARVGELEVSTRQDLREEDLPLREGDLVVVDADAGQVRVLGQAPDALALHHDLVSLRQANLDTRSEDPARFLAARGRLLKARHQLQRLLTRLDRHDLARHATHELLESGARDAATLLGALFDNPHVGPVARQTAHQQLERLRARWRQASQAALQGIPTARNTWEVVYLRLQTRRLEWSLEEISQLLEVDQPAPRAPLDGPSRVALGRLAQAGYPLARRLQGLPLPPSPPPAADALVLTASDPGDLQPRVGAKAANLARIAAVVGQEHVPAWFAVADASFQLVMDAPFRGSTLREHVDRVLSAEADPQRASRAVRALWESVRLPPEVVEVVSQHYAALGPDDPWVAVRSSTLEEDSEEAAWAGQFDTFLYVRGASSVLEHLVLAWAGMWTPRAIAQRRATGEGRLGGGILVQRMVDSRVSGVLHTVSAGTGRLDEVVINVGLGLGEGVVSGLVEVDQVRVSKRTDLLTQPLQLSYSVGDKTTRVVRDTRRGQGTTIEPTLYHERLRPALEYVELEELVRAAVRLEAAFHQPLDVEFALEGQRLHLLQARPVGLFSAALRETLSSHPLEGS